MTKKNTLPITENIVSVTDSRLTNKVEILKLTTRALNCLRSQNIQYIGDLIQYSIKELCQIKNLGGSTAWKINQALSSVNLTFEMKVKF